jgi:hypothetical protein
MRIRYLSAAVMTAGLLMAASAFAQSTAAQKQPTQEGGGATTPCNLAANPSANPDCKNYKQRTEGLVLPVNVDFPRSAGR